MILFFGVFLAFGDELLSQFAVLRFWILVQEAVALVLGITIAVCALVFAGVLGQLELALHDQQREVLTVSHEGIGLQGILGHDDARRVVAFAVRVDIAEIAAQVIVELG